MNSIIAMTAHLYAPKSVAEIMAKIELSLRAQTEQSVYHEARLETPVEVVED